MPLVHIHLVRDVRSPSEMREVADIVQEVMLDKFNAPPRDRYQVRIPVTSFSMQAASSHAFSSALRFYLWQYQISFLTPKFLR